MSAVSFSTKVDKETDEAGDWVVITLRGKWYDSCFFRVCDRAPDARSGLRVGNLRLQHAGFPSPASRYRRPGPALSRRACVCT